MSATRRQFAVMLAATAVAPGALRAQSTADTRDVRTIILDDLVAANRILANEGVIDAFGHVSCRHPDRSGRFLMARLRVPGLVEASDVIEIDGEGNPLDARGGRPSIERFIHAGFYAERPDVRSVIHCHSAELIPFGVSATPLRALSHVGGIIGGRVPVWDIADVVGPSSNLLVTNLEVGRDLARSMGSGNCVLLRGHGAAIAGSSIRQAVVTAVTLNSQARILQDAIALGGGVKVLSPGEIAETAKIFSPEVPGDAVGRSWEYFCVRAGIPFYSKGA